MSPLVKRHLRPIVSQLLSAFPAVDLRGARQVGKSTLADLVGDASKRPLVRRTLDDAEVRQLAENDPRGFVSQVPNGLLVIDEVQRVPELALALKASIDADRRPGRFLVTGSVDWLKQRSLDSLAGRLVSTQVFGFSQGELAGRRDDFVLAIANDQLNTTPSSQYARSDYVDLLARGSMPEAVRLEQRPRAIWLESYLERLLSRDLTELTRLSDPLRIRGLLTALAATQGSETVIARLGNRANLPASTTADYVDLLRALFLVERIPPWTANLLKREVGRSKYLVTDSALAMMLTRTTPTVLNDIVRGGAIGGLLESFVAAELLRQRGWAGIRFDVFHYRSPDGREIDLVCHLEDDRIIAIEVKAAQSVTSSDYRNLVWLREQLGDRMLAGVVLTLDTHTRRLDDRIWAAPVSVLWEL